MCKNGRTMHALCKRAGLEMRSGYHISAFVSCAAKGMTLGERHPGSRNLKLLTRGF